VRSDEVEFSIRVGGPRAGADAADGRGARHGTKRDGNGRHAFAAVVPWGQPTEITLSATATDPAPDEGSTLQGPYWSWTVSKVEYSDDGVSFTTGGTYSTEIQNGTLANASLKAWFYQGAYWRITCRVTVSYSETPGATTWTGTATCAPLPNSGELVSITVASGATQTNVSQTSDNPNWAAVKLSGSDVIIKATVKPNTGDVANLIQWTNGGPVGGDNTQRTVDRGTSAMTAVQAVIGEAPTQGVNIWIIWATVTIQITDNRADDNNADADTGGNWPANYGGGKTLGAIDHDAVPGLTYAYTIGKIQATGKLTPAGIGQVIAKDAWKLKRTVEAVAWDNVGHYTNQNDPTTWAAGPSVQRAAGTDDTTNTPSLRDWDPTSGGSVDTIYDTDAPGCSTALDGITIYHTSELYANFTQFVTVTLDAEETCSDNAVWSYQAQVDVDKDAGKRIDLNKLDTALIDVAARIKNGPNYLKR
jgi:hypothetical protein